MRAVRFTEYGGVDVLNVDEVPTPTAGLGQVLVQVRAAGINPGEAKIRDGLMHARFPATFPSGQGSDLAGIVAALGSGATGVAVGEHVIGYTNNRASHADYVLAEAEHLTPKPDAVSWEVAGGLFVAGATVVVAGAAGGVGSIAVQLARLTGAAVVGLASQQNHDWLVAHGVKPVAYGDGVAGRIRHVAPKVDAFIDTHGADYVQLALELGVSADRIDTIANFGAVARFGVKAEGSAAGASAGTLAQLAGLAATGQLEVPITATFPLDDVRDAYRLLASGHVRGKIVLIP
jgi:NADPH:quinone reductase-like Zn-dependent oxidoreductase